MASVHKNRDDESKYTVLEKMGRSFIILKAGNNQEIARSCALDAIEGVQYLEYLDLTQRIRERYLAKSEANDIDAETQRIREVYLKKSGEI